MEHSRIPEAIRPYLPFIQGVLVAIALLIVGWIASKWVNRLTRRGFQAKKLDQALGGFLAAMLQYTVLAAAVIAALGAVGIQTTSVVALFATAGLAIGLALQGSLSNFASGVMILFFRPFNIDHKITAGGHTGVVTDIGLFATTLLSPDNETMIVPNSAITGGTIVNFTSKGTLRGHVNVGVANGSDVAKTCEVLLAAARRTKLVLAEPAPAVAFVSIGPRALELTILAWTNTSDYLDMLHDLRRAAYEDLNAAGIEIPVSQVVIAPAA